MKLMHKWDNISKICYEKQKEAQAKIQAKRRAKK